MTKKELRELADRLRWIDQQPNNISLKLADEVCKKLPAIIRGLDIAASAVSNGDRGSKASND